MAVPFEPFSRYADLPKTVNKFFEIHKKIDSRWSTLSNYKRESLEEGAKYLRKHPRLRENRNKFEETRKRLSIINKKIDKIYEMDIPDKIKREKTQRLLKLRLKMARKALDFYRKYNKS